MKRFCVIVFALISSVTILLATDRMTFRDKGRNIEKDSVLSYEMNKAKQFDIHISFSHKKTPNTDSEFQICLNDSTHKKGYSVCFNWKDKPYEDFDGSRELIISVVDLQKDSILFARTVTDPKTADLYKGTNSITFYGSRFADIDVYLNKTYYLGRLDWVDDIQNITLLSSFGSILKLIKTSYIKDNIEDITTNLTFDDIKHIVESSNDSIVGFYKYLDRENDPRIASPGGKYNIAVVPTEEKGKYDVLYINNALTFSHIWKLGMRKAILTKTIFVNHFDVEWYDSKQTYMNDEISATLTLENTVLEFNFPVYKAKIRFSKIIN